MTPGLSARKASVVLVVPVLGAALGVVLLARAGRTPLQAEERIASAAVVATPSTEQSPAVEDVAGPTAPQQREAVLLGTLSAHRVTPAVTVLDCAQPARPST